MIKPFLRNIIRFIVIIALQVLLFNNIQFSGYVNPYFYVLFILLMPFETPGWLLLTVAFILGLSVDVFSHTIGMHTSATVFMAFLRPYVLHSISPRDGYEFGTYPRIHYYGFTWFLKYALILVFFHHLFLFYIEVFRFVEFFDTLLRVILSTIFSVIFIVLSQFITFRY